MANLTISQAVINMTFKGLLASTVAFALTRLVCQIDPKDNRISYLQLTFWLVVEAAVGLIAASIASYRVIVLEYLKLFKTGSQQHIVLAEAESRDLSGANLAPKASTPNPHTGDGSGPEPCPERLSSTRLPQASSTPDLT